MGSNMELASWEIRLNVRSGLVSGLLEAIAILIFAPLITGATTRVYNALTTRRVLRGSPVRIRDNSLSVEDIIPRVIRVIRTASSRKQRISSSVETPLADSIRQLLPLFISIVMSVSIILTSSFVDGISVPVYTTKNMFLWNGGMFVDTTRSTGVDKKADDVRGMAGVRRACVERVDTKTFNLYAAAFFEEQDFKFGRAANNSVCVNGRDTKQKIGITLEVDRIFNPVSTEYLTVEEMEGTPANFTFLENIRRTGTGDDCRVRVTTSGSTTDWTFGEEARDGSRFATRATVDANGTITLSAGVAYRHLDAPETWDGVNRSSCEELATELFAPNRFTATITAMGIQQDPRQLELVVADLLKEVAFSGYGRVESQEVMLRSYYAGAANSDEDSSQSFGTFVPRQIESVIGTKQITTISIAAAIGLVLTIVGCFISLLILIFVRPTVRVTSVSYISRLYSGRDWQNQDADVMTGEVEYIGIEKTYDGSVYAAPLQVQRDVPCR